MEDSPITVGPFAEAAMTLHHYGLAPIPCATDCDGKVPGILWGRWRRRPGVKAIQGFVGRFPTSNIGIVTGLSGVTIVDVDDPDIVPAMIDRFGETPLHIQTPSGGVHLWFGSSGEGCSDLRRVGLPVDIKGLGGFVVTPPSVRPSGPHAGRPYALKQGTWDDLGRLPKLKPGSLADLRALATRVPTKGKVQEGRRNASIFRKLLRHVPCCDTFDDLLDKARGLNEECEPVLPDAEVAKIAASAWTYQQDGRNWVGQESRAVVAQSEWATLAAYPRGPDAHMLLTMLRLRHSNRSNFVASPKAMASHKLIAGWGHDKYRSALRLLTDLRFLAVVQDGGHGPHDPRLFRFADAAPFQERSRQGAAGGGCTVIIGSRNPTQAEPSMGAATAKQARAGSPTR